MSLLERNVSLLTTARAAAAVDPLLSILIRCGLALASCRHARISEVRKYLA